MSVLGPDSPLFEKEPSKRGQWMAHHPLLVPLALLVVAPTQEIFHSLSSTGQRIAFILSQISVFLMLFEIWASVRHLRGFCDYCFHQPAGGPAVAKKHRRQLRVHHMRADSKRWVYISFVLLLCLPTILLNHWPYVVYIIAFFFFFGLLDKASQVHAWLIPWCPWCKDDGRWQEPSPTPDPSMTKVHS